VGTIREGCSGSKKEVRMAGVKCGFQMKTDILEKKAEEPRGVAGGYTREKVRTIRGESNLPRRGGGNMTGWGQERRFKSDSCSVLSKTN